MKLNIAERITLLGILPKEGDFTTLKILRELQENIGLSEEDHKENNIRKIAIFDKDGQASGSSIRWGIWSEEEIKEASKAKAKLMEKENIRLTKNPPKPVEIKFGDKALDIVKDALIELDKNKKLTAEHITLYERFVQDKEEK